MDLLAVAMHVTHVTADHAVKVKGSAAPAHFFAEMVAGVVFELVDIDQRAHVHGVGLDALQKAQGMHQIKRPKKGIALLQ